jgi:hypothetical protein
MTCRLLDRVSTPHASHAAVPPCGARIRAAFSGALSGTHAVLRTPRESSCGERGRGRTVRVFWHSRALPHRALVLRAQDPTQTRDAVGSANHSRESAMMRSDCGHTHGSYSAHGARGKTSAGAEPSILLVLLLLLEPRGVGFCDGGGWEYGSG